MTERSSQLLSALETARGPLSGPQLSELLQVSTRSIRKYVREINRRAAQELVQADHRGYVLDRAALHRWRERQLHRKPEYVSPEQRLYFVVRHLVTHSSTGTDVFELGEQLYVSPSTIEADLGKARELFREFGLRVRRERDLLYLDGTERDQRRLVRQVLLQAGQGMSPKVIQGFAKEFSAYNVRALSRGIQRQLSGTDLEIDEYALQDIVIHLTIAADRVRQGHQLFGPESPPDATAEELAATRRLVAEVATEYGVDLPASEAAVLTVMLRARARRRRSQPLDSAVRVESLELVRDAMRELSATYLLELYDEGALGDLAFHVQNLIERSGQGTAFESPLGDSFRRMHPFIHELALFFAQQLEKRTGIVVEPGEVDFLSFHLGTQFQRQLEQGSPVTVTVVVPRHGSRHTEIVSALSAALGDQAVITEVVSTLDHDWSGLATDLVVSALNLNGLTTVPVVPISPLLRREDVDRVCDAVRAERQRAARQEVRSSIVTMIEPGLFHGAAEVSSQLEALQVMCRTMQAEGVTDEYFLQDVLDRESRSSTAFGDQFAIPHSLTMNAHRSAISVMVTEEAIQWGGSNVRLVVLFAVSPNSGRLFRNVLDGAIRVLTDPVNVTTLIAAAGSHAEFVRALAGLLE